MFKLEMTEEDVGTLQAAVENMRAGSTNGRVLEARWELAFKLEQLARRAEEARRKS